MVTGATLRSKVLRDARGGVVVVRVVRPDYTEGNRTALLTTEKMWAAEAKRLPVGSEAAKRAKFASDVAFLGAQTLIRPLADHYILVAVDDLGTVRGLSMYRLDAGTWHLDLHTVAPRDQGGNPNPNPVRGIGSELLGAATADMAARVCSRVELEPLDAKAERYWRSRGFHNTVEPLHLSCPELQRLAATYAHTPTDDEHQLCDRRMARRRVSLRVESYSHWR